MNDVKKDFQKRDRRRVFIVAALVVFGFGILAFSFFQVQPVINDNTSGQAATASKSRRARNAALQQYVEDMRQADAELLARWRNIREARRNTNEDPGHARRHYEQRLSEMEAEFERFKDSADKKNSVGWDMKRAIKKFKSDGPPLN